MLLWTILLMCLFVILFPTFGGKKNRFLRLVHPYSGLDPHAWLMFQHQLKTYDDETQTLAGRAKALYSSIDNIQTLALGIRRSDDHVYQEKLEDIAQQLGIEGESSLFQEAKKQGVYFFPKYLNDLVPTETKTDVNFTGASVDNHFPDPRSHGQ